jgi:hypothetical protein
MSQIRRVAIAGLAAGVLAISGCASGTQDVIDKIPDVTGIDPTCPQLYAKMASEVLASKTIPKAKIDAWAQQAKEAAAAARSGDLATANQICRQTTTEIEAELS